MMLTSIHSLLSNLRHFHNKWLQPVLPTKQWGMALTSYARYLSDWLSYSRLAGHETWRFQDTYPCLFDRSAATSFDAHYLYQDVWAFEWIASSGTRDHVDIGSHIIFVGMLTAITRVTFVDIRPLAANLENLDCRPGNILDLPFEDGSVASLSCLHVAEHVGLGRYGDPLDPAGTEKAAKELVRVMAPGGNLYFSLPIGKPRICFNAHRVHSPRQVLDFFHDLRLIHFSGVDDGGMPRRDASPSDFSDSSYACGVFHFVKK